MGGKGRAIVDVATEAASTCEKRAPTDKDSEEGLDRSRAGGENLVIALHSREVIAEAFEGKRVCLSSVGAEEVLATGRWTLAIQREGSLFSAPGSGCIICSW